MKIKYSPILAAMLVVLLAGWTFPGEWIAEKHNGYRMQFTAADKSSAKEYAALIDKGIGDIEQFFGKRYQNDFLVLIHPGRKSLDSTWQKDWNAPDFKSECWMVASGIASKLDLLSPQRWDAESCEHTYADPLKTQQLITHELVHVYHGQHNPSPDFSDVQGIDWLVEGLATYASGQCDSVRLAEVKKLVAAEKNPVHLEEFWTGKSKYGLSGSMVMYIDKTYGRAKIIELMQYNRLADVLQSLGVSEEELIRQWKIYFAA